MKQFIKAATFILLLGAFLSFFSCAKVKIPIVIPYTPSGFTIEITTPPAGGLNPAGKKDFNKAAIDNAVAQFLKDKNIAVANITAIDLTDLTAEIIGNTALDFGDIDSGVFNLGGSDVATVTKPPTGKKASYTIVKPNVLAILTASTTSYSLSITTNKPTPAATIQVKYSVNITYTL
jgi:hypothetical protein